MKYIPALDGLRALSALAIVACHVERGSIAQGGFIGVDIFSVLSGFLVTILFIQERERTGTIDLPRFFTRRVLRLMPALWAMVIIVLILTYPEWPDLHETVLTLTYTENIWLAFQTSAEGFFAHTWSLGIELQFYICWAFGALLLLRHSPKRAAVALGIAIFAIYCWRWNLATAEGLYGDDYLRAMMRIYVSIDTRADELLTGCLGALLVSVRPAVVRDALGRYGGILATIGLCVAASVFAPYTTPYFLVGIPMVSAYSILVILDITLNENGLLARLMSWRPLVYIGTISYGIYLWHIPLLGLLQRTSFDSIGARLIVMFGGTIVIAALSSRFIEKPIRDYGRVLASRPISSGDLRASDSK